MASLGEHEEFRRESERQYLTERDAKSDALDWKNALWEARKEIVAFLRASDCLYDVAGALVACGSHSIPMRHFLAPPVSQDQFKLICPLWSKSIENSGRGFKAHNAAAIAAVFEERRSKRLTAWVDRARAPRMDEITGAIGAIAPLIASQRVSTARRGRLSSQQEGSVISLLEAKAWTKLPSRLVSAGGLLPAKCFMHKTRFASGPSESQEVDIACGLGGTFVLALECKVTNDHTNSVKRINDVLKKAHAWKSHWGSFVKPAAVLQGVIKGTDVQRLLDNGVHVFWSHRLDLLSRWLDENEV